MLWLHPKPYTFKKKKDGNTLGALRADNIKTFQIHWNENVSLKMCQKLLTLQDFEMLLSPCNVPCCEVTVQTTGYNSEQTNNMFIFSYRNTFSTLPLAKDCFSFYAFSIHNILDTVGFFYFGKWDIKRAIRAYTTWWCLLNLWLTWLASIQSNVSLHLSMILVLSSSEILSLILSSSTVLLIW